MNKHERLARAIDNLLRHMKTLKVDEDMEAIGVARSIIVRVLDATDLTEFEDDWFDGPAT